MDKLNNALKLQAEFQSITTGMGGFSNATEQTRAKSRCFISYGR